MRWVVPSEKPKKLKHGGTRDAPRRYDIPHSIGKASQIHADGGTRYRCEDENNSNDGGTTYRTYISVPDGVHETETLNHISKLMPDGWCKQKAQARSGMGNRVGISTLPSEPLTHSKP